MAQQCCKSGCREHVAQLFSMSVIQGFHIPQSIPSSLPAVTKAQISGEAPGLTRMRAVSNRIGLASTLQAPVSSTTRDRALPLIIRS